MRVIGVVSQFLDYLDLRLGSSSGVVVVVCRVVFIFLLFTWLNHLISCAWVAIGFHAPSDTGMRWMDLSVLSGEQVFRDTSLLYQYLTAMHWSMAQASVPGLVAVNSWERVACVWLRLVDKIFNCTLISALSAIMVGHTMLNSKQSVEFRKLGIFLKDNGVSNRTALRVRKEAMRRMARPDVLSEEHVPVVGSHEGKKGRSWNTWRRNRFQTKEGNTKAQHDPTVRVNIARVAVCCVRALFAEASCPQLCVGSCVSTCWVGSWSAFLRSISGTHAVRRSSATFASRL